MEPQRVQIKYQNLTNQEKYAKFRKQDGQIICYTGQFKYVEIDLDDNGQKMVKRKRVFKKIKKERRFLTNEQRHEIE